jgi:hypothetical protein
MTWIKTYFETHQAVSVSAIEREAKLPRNTLHNYLNGSKPGVPEKHLPKIERVLKKYGLGLAR